MRTRSSHHRAMVFQEFITFNWSFLQPRSQIKRRRWESKWKASTIDLRRQINTLKLSQLSTEYAFPWLSRKKHQRFLSQGIASKWKERRHITQIGRLMNRRNFVPCESANPRNQNSELQGPDKPQPMLGWFMTPTFPPIHPKWNPNCHPGPQWNPNFPSIFP